MLKHSLITLGIGMGVDANILTATRIREEPKTASRLTRDYNRLQARFTAVFDGNITVILITVVLMGAFGPPDSIFSTILKPIFFLFGSATEGTIYSFGYTLIVGIIGNFIMGVTASRVMLRSLSKFKCFRIRNSIEVLTNFPTSRAGGSLSENPFSSEKKINPAT